MQPFNKEAFELLAEKMLLGTISPSENAQLNEWLSVLENTERQRMADENEDELSNRILNKIKQDIGLGKKIRRKKLTSYRWQIAASLLLIIGLSVGFYYYKNKSAAKYIAQTDIVPGGNGAVLTLSDGHKVILDSSGNIAIADQGSAQVSNKNGILQYNNNSKQTGNEAIVYNTLSTPKGKQYKLILPDGTAVWLNAGSSIKYPVAFTQKIRSVEITGEAYFEVIHNSASPFQVKAGNQTIEDIGTHFDISAYPEDKDVTTTLAEGKVNIRSNKHCAILIPGQAASTNNSINSEISIKEADVDAVLGWKNGYFQFNHAPLEIVMQQLSRWYNVNIVYQDALPHREFSGKIHRNINASEALEILKYTGVNFTIEGDKIIVSP